MSDVDETVIDDVRYLFVWSDAPAFVRERVSVFWQEQGVVPAGDETERLNELVLVAMTDSDEVLCVCSGRPRTHEPLGIPLHELRLLTKAGLRHHRLASNAIQTAYQKLGEHNQSISPPDAVGLIFILENQQLMLSQRQPIWITNRAIHVGLNDAGHDVRIRYFPQARLSDLKRT
ncbi:MAG: hypothetical protein AAF525_06200 [Pseudomonadota bacterium]